jgi:hypothetical protein
MNKLRSPREILADAFRRELWDSDADQILDGTHPDVDIRWSLTAIAQAQREALEAAAEVAFQKSATLPHDSDLYRGYANGRSDAGIAIRNLIPDNQEARDGE